MAIIFQKKQNKQTALILILIFLILVIGLAIWFRFFREPPVVIKEKVPIVEIINFEDLRKPLKVILPYFSVDILFPFEHNYFTVEPNELIDLTILLSGTTTNIPFTYKFDCDNDGKFENEKTVTDIYGDDFIALDICQFEEPGKYTIRVLVKGKFDYYRDKERIQREQLVESFIKVIVRGTNLPPVVISCDVDSIAGSTLYDFKFRFSVESYDPEGDEIVYFWNFGDGITIDTPNSIYFHQYKKSGHFFPFVRVTDIIQEEARSEKVLCFPDSLFLLREYILFETIDPFKYEIGRKNPFIPIEVNIHPEEDIISIEEKPEEIDSLIPVEEAEIIPFIPIEEAEIIPFVPIEEAEIIPFVPIEEEVVNIHPEEDVIPIEEKPEEIDSLIIEKTLGKIDISLADKMIHIKILLLKVFTY